MNKSSLITGFSFAQKHVKNFLKKFKKSVDKTFWRVYNIKVPYREEQKVHWKVNKKSFKKPSGSMPRKIKVYRCEK